MWVNSDYAVLRKTVEMTVPAASPAGFEIETKVNERSCVVAGSLERVTSTIKHAPRAGHALCIDPCNCGRKTPHGNSLPLPNPFFLDWKRLDQQRLNQTLLH